jgi:hypothetical protein
VLERAGEPTDLHMFSRDTPAPLTGEQLTAAAEGVDLRVS